MVEKQVRDARRWDVETPSEESSKIQEFFVGTSVFLTGATGFIGKLMLEKLLRTCTGIENVYILIREKKGKSIEKRFEELLGIVMFDRLKREQPKFIDKIIVLSGDCALPNLGLNNEDQQKLIDKVGFVFHCAATVRFDAKIRAATYINVRATRDILDLSRKMKNLKAIVYVSTAYSNCVRLEINEKFYQPTITGNSLLTLVEALKDDTLDKVTSPLIGDWPNTYVFTKCVAEDLVRTHGEGLPIAVVRPSVVTATVSEPIAGWIDNVYGVTGIIQGAALGLIRTLHCDKTCSADIVPADYVVNCAIAAAWDAGTTRTISNKQDTHDGEKEESTIPVYNYVCSTQKPITWSEVMDMSERHLKQVPSPLAVWHYCFRLNSSYFIHWLFLVFLHRIPAYIIDFIARCIGKEPMMVKGYQKIEKFLDVISYFSTKTWRFQNNNVQALWKKLNVEDQKSFAFGLDNFDWEEYSSTCAKGGRVYLLKDPMDTLPQGRVKYLKLQIAHYVLVGLVLLGLLKMLMVVWNAVF